VGLRYPAISLPLRSSFRISLPDAEDRRAAFALDATSVLFAAIAGGSTVGGLAFGARPWPFDERAAVAVLLCLFGVFLALMAGLLTAGAVSLPFCCRCCSSAD